DVCRARIPQSKRSVPNSPGSTKPQIPTNAVVAIFDAAKRLGTAGSLLRACRNEVLDVPLGILLRALSRIRMVWIQIAWLHDGAVTIIPIETAISTVCVPQAGHDSSEPKWIPVYLARLKT